MRNLAFSLQRRNEATRGVPKSGRAANYSQAVIVDASGAFASADEAVEPALLGRRAERRDTGAQNTSAGSTPRGAAIDGMASHAGPARPVPADETEVVSPLEK